MKKIILFFVLIVSVNCSSKKDVSGIYVLTKKTNSYNIVLKLENNVYSLQTISTGLKGVTNGVYSVDKKLIKLIPEERKFIKDSIYVIEEYKPFRDTLLFEVKRNKLVPKNNTFPKVLYKYDK